MSKNFLTGKDVYLVDGKRTPFLKAEKGLGPFSASTLAVRAAQQLLVENNLDPMKIDETIIGSAMPSPDEANIARVVALRLGLSERSPAWTVMRNCASGMQALDSAAKSIASNRAQLVLAGGTDAMSHAPLLLNQKMANWLAGWFASKTLSQKGRLLGKLRPAYFVPVIALLRGLTDPIVGLNMGQTAENLAYLFDISRKEMDEFAVRSHLNLAKQKGALSEIAPIIDSKGRVYDFDTGLREDSSVARLAKLKPFFDKRYGKVTAGNSSQITDGACMVLLASKEAVETYNLPVLAKISDVNWAGLNPAEMGLGPVHAMVPMLQRNELSLSDIDYFEINEAFAAQVLACLKALSDDAYCQKHFQLEKAFGELPIDKLNQDGGAIACGHPIGASGARILLHTAKVLEKNNLKRGTASICIGGGQGGAMLVERV
jgi:acetyl-CoA C-acetyltransferase